MPPEPITVNLVELLRLGPRSKVDLGDGHVYEVRLPYEQTRAAQIELQRISDRRGELQKIINDAGLVAASEDDVAELDRLTVDALDHLVADADDYIRQTLSPAQRADLLDMVGLVNVRAMSDQKKAVESTTSTLLSSVPAPSARPSSSGSRKPRRAS